MLDAEEEAVHVQAPDGSLAVCLDLLCDRLVGLHERGICGIADRQKLTEDCFALLPLLLQNAGPHHCGIVSGLVESDGLLVVGLRFWLLINGGLCK